MALVAGLLAAARSASAASPIVGTIRAISPRAPILIHHRGAPSPLVVTARPQDVVPGDIVSTTSSNRAEVVFKSFAKLALGPNSALQVGFVPPYRPTLTQGQARCTLLKSILIGAPAAIVRNFGSEYELDVQPDGTTRVTVIDGTVEFFNDQGSRTVHAAETSTARPGLPPTAPAAVPNPELAIQWSFDLDQALLPLEKRFGPAEAPANALAAARQRAADQPADPDAHIDYGDVLFDARQLAPALAEYQRAAELAPARPEPWIRAGYTLLEMGRLDESAADFQKAMDIGGRAGPAQVGLAWVELTRNSADSIRHAEALAREAVDARPMAVEPRLVLALSLMRQPDKLKQAEGELKTAAEGEPAADRYQALAWIGIVYLAENQPADALHAAQAARQSAPGSALAAGSLALADFYNGRSLDSAREARRAIRLDPQSVAGRVALGQALLDLGEVDEATRIAAEAATIDPGLPQARYQLGVALAQVRDYHHAQQELQACLALAPDFLPAASLLARIETLQGHKGEAVALLRGIQARHPDSDEVAAALGEVYYQQANYPAAIVQYQAAIRRSPRSAVYYAGMARLLLDANRLADAIRAGQTAVALAPGVGQFHAQLGRIYGFSGLNAQADRELRTALTLDPQNALALALLAFHHVGADPRTASTSYLQGFLLDPAISTQLLRGGIDTSVTAAGGTHRQRDFDLTHRDVGAAGALHDLGSLDDNRTDGARPKADFSIERYQQHVTVVADRRTNVYLNLDGNHQKRGLPGEDFLETPSPDRSSFGFGQALLGMRRREGTASYLWVGLFRNASRENQLRVNDNPLLDETQRTSSSLYEPELRFDLNLARNPLHRSVLTFGAAAVRGYLNVRQLHPEIPDSGLPPVVRSLLHEEDRSWMGYLQWTHSVTGRLSVSAQLRKSSFHRQPNDCSECGVDTPGTVARALAQGTKAILPSMIATYQADPRTTVRLTAGRRQTDPLSSIFAPTETLLTTELYSQPYGIPNTMRLIQLDLERYLPGRAFAKLFLFDTVAEGVSIGGLSHTGFSTDLPVAAIEPLELSQWRGYGAGVRYERPLSRDLNGYLGFVARETRARVPNTTYALNHGPAPYEPGHVAQLGLNYLDPSGTKWGLAARHVGSFYQDTSIMLDPARESFPARTYVDLTLAKEPTVHSELFAAIYNLFGQREIAYNGFPISQRLYTVGYTQRF